MCSKIPPPPRYPTPPSTRTVPGEARRAGPAARPRPRLLAVHAGVADAVGAREASAAVPRAVAGEAGRARAAPAPQRTVQQSGCGITEARRGGRVARRIHPVVLAALLLNPSSAISMDRDTPPVMGWIRRAGPSY